MTVEIKRGGSMTGGWSGSGKYISLGRDVNLPQGEGSVVFNLEIPAGGRGDTHVQVLVGPGEFEKLARMMVEANRDRAIKAFGAALQSSTA